ncbi:peptidase family M1-domain-containing protein [Aspergillus pseudotamarii]|uniref:Aminopeptidase n=1 Tax=Aspergillus pseudotamarii TaxID=132259 RepID=A0A5N6SJN1_ASPPS|nr:peptidase family M1-domain-containing protein [Aspergillus pseudotamarii]KAE8133891.1 peptidase family M1-domain-containing protein [Aspergillus pseudotamarii]
MCRRADVPSGSTNITHGREVLPTNVKPVHYDLTLEPNFESFKYEGTVVIDLQVTEDTTSISLNSNEIDIHSAIVSAQGSVVTSSPEISINKDNQVATVKFAETIPAGSSAQLKLTFTGILNDNMAGFYRSSYKTKDGETKYLASTQMEPTDARRAFPCFDEPALKAKFTVTLIADKSMTCLSNMDVASETDAEGGKKVVKFNTSPLMSTYLVAFIVGHLNYIETKDFRVPIRVYATPDQDIEHGRFSLDLAAKTLAFYEKAFDNSFPLPKMDMVAVPDFSAGAMENWGLITYRIVDVLLDEKNSGASRKERIAEVVQHELAHQWFGNLVTMDFWDGLWLNEGFATWMSWYSCNSFFPEWKVWQTYVIDSLQGALSLDSLRSSHPIEVPVKRADEINQIFDAISYMKGSSVLRMISKYLGEDVFIQGVRNYIKKHAYGNTQTGDLWAALADASGKPVEQVMDIWTKNVGFPVVTVAEDAASSSIKLTQNRFLRTGDVRPEEDTTLYPVMLGLRTKQGLDENTMLTEREGQFKVPDLDFYKLNADHSAIYRTSYTPERLTKLGEAAKQGLLTVEDRAGMIADAGALASSGYQSTSGLLSLLKGFDNESEFIVWNEIVARVGTLRAAWLFEDIQARDALKAFQRALVSSKTHEIGWEFSEKDGHILQQFKALLFSAAGSAEDPVVVKAAQEMFQRFAAGETSAIHPNIRGSVFSIVLKNGGEKEYNVVYDRFRNAPTSDEKTTALRCLGSAEDPALIQRTLGLALSDEVKNQDIYMPLGGLRNHTAGIEARWAWMKNNWDALYKRLPPGLGMLGTVVQLTTSSFCTESQLKEVEDFFKDKDTKGFDRAVEQSLDAIRAKINWINRDRTDVESWLKSNAYLRDGKL